ncbi:unnamed protein product [Didymodactylos carnosus]|uniref:RanBP2-type domain-containing protein n=1 Tax=Didymodactylos carnosus TaxID=1234261 RepID=A0A8S2R6G4_9BILA|nr:unnamed protein product [Didymodactylos carnosus]CAF4147495.1 unnamed protein product [Didymodactylos carnosus]
MDHPHSSKHKKILEWHCTQCSYINSTDYELCIMCGLGEQPLPLQTKYNMNNNLRKKHPNKHQDIYSSNTNINTSDEEIFFIKQQQHENPTIITNEVNWTCGECTLENLPSIKICEVCGANRAFSEINMPVINTMEATNVQSSTNNTTIYNNNSGSIEYYVPETEYESKYQQSLEWDCSKCTYMNSINDKICVICNNGSRPASLQLANNISIDNKSTDSRHKQMSVEQHDRKVNSQTKVRSVSHKQNEYNNNITTDNNYISQQSLCGQYNIIPTNEQISAYPENGPISKASTTYSISQSIRDVDEDVKVYIIDLPHTIPDEILEPAIRSRLETCYNIKVKIVKCYSIIGIGIITLQNHDKINLLTKIQNILLNFTIKTVTLTFVEELELISYMVLDHIDKQKLPSNEEIKQKWINTFPADKSPIFQTISIQFPNIIEMTSYSIGELMKFINNDVFLVNEQIARVFIRGNCYYVEDLPQSIQNSDLLFCYIATQLDMCEQD